MVSPAPSPAPITVVVNALYVKVEPVTLLVIIIFVESSEQIVTGVTALTIGLGCTAIFATTESTKGLNVLEQPPAVAIMEYVTVSTLVPGLINVCWMLPI